MDKIKLFGLMDIEELEDYLLTEIFQRSPLQVVPTLQDKGH